MRALVTLFLSLSLAFSLSTFAATSAETAEQVRAKWSLAKTNLENAVKTYQSNTSYATAIQNYAQALDKAGVTLEQYLALKLASPATPPEKLTPVVDQLYKDLNAVRTLYSKSPKALLTTFGAAYSQHNEAAQTALKNMR
ncbi:MAG: hypothetical protein ACOZB0_01365 [Pseudomonadota bacterium]